MSWNCGPETAVTEADIQAALRDKERVRLDASSRILPIQSGADLPDAPMLEALRAHHASPRFPDARALPRHGTLDVRRALRSKARASARSSHAPRSIGLVQKLKAEGYVALAHALVRESRG